MHKSSSRFSPCRIVAAFIACCVGVATTQAVAVDYTWGSATTGGSWSVTTNWTPTGAPTSADTALLDNATANRTVFYDTAASGTLTGLSFTQTTSSILNELLVRRGIRVTNALVLGASSGTAQLTLAGTSAASITGTFSGGITVNSGGVLSLANFNPAGSASVFNSNLTGNVTVSGGRLDFSWVKEGTATSSGNTGQTLTGNLTMSSGTIAFDNPLGSSPDRRLTITGDVSVTGGRLTTSATSGVSNIFYSGTSILFAPTSYDDARFQIGLTGTSAQTYSGSTALATLVARGTGIKTVSNSGTISTIQMIDGDSTGRTATTLKLASNLTAGSGGLAAATFSQQGTTFDYGVDADIYTLDLSGASGAWTPTVGGGTAASPTAQWALAGNGGRIIANGFNLATANVGTTIGPSLILESRAGNSVANTLSLGTSGTGTIDATSVFRYAGTAAVATPSTLTSSRAIGDLEVTSGALRISSLTGLQNVRVTGGTLDLNSLSLSVTSGSFGGGSVTSGTLTSGTFLATSGSVGASLAGSGGTLTKTTSGTFTLSGSNAYDGGTRINGGVLAIDNTFALGTSGSVTFGGGTLQYTANSALADISARVLGSGSAISVDTNGQTVTFASAIAASNSGGLTKLGAGTLALTASNAFTGSTTVSAGTLALGNGGTAGSVDGAISLASGASLLVNRSNNLTLAQTISGSGSLAKQGAGTLTLTNANTYTGPTTVSGGTLALGAGGGDGIVAGPIVLSNTAGLVVNRSNNATLDGTISGTGSLTKQGAGTLTLTAANTYAGATTISAGTIALSGGNNRLATTGTVNFTGNGGLSVNGSQSLARVTLSDNVSAALTGSGTVTVTGAAFFVGGSGSNTSQTLNATGLSSFAYSNAASSFKVGGNNTNGTAVGSVVLPANAAITASSIGIGTDPNNFAISSGTLTLGATTTLSSNAITLGSSLSQGTINVAAGTVSPVLTIRAANGTSAVSNMTIGTSDSGYGLTTASRVDLTGGTGASTLDALVTTLVIGQSTRSTSFNQLINTSGGLLMQSGTLTATTITLGQTLNSPTFSASGQVISGSLSVSGGTVNAGTLYLANQNWTSGTVTGIFALNGGGTLNAGTIASGTGAGAGAASRTFQWNDGTIANRDASTDLTIGSGIAFTLANTGTHRFSIGSGRSGSVASVLAGVGGTLEKAGAGTLTLSANNTYTGATTVSAGTLLVNGNQSAAVGAVTVAAGATLGGSGTIGGAVTVNGFLSPGNSPGLLSVASLVLGGTSTSLFEIDGTTRATQYDGADVTGALTYGGSLVIDFGSGITTAFTDNTIFNLFDFGSQSGAFTSITTANDGSFYAGLTFTPVGGGNTWTATKDSQTLEFTHSTGELVIVPEPGAIALAAIGIAAAAWARHRK